MIYRRHYLQYNDFVFDEFDMIAEDDSSASFKTFSQEYGFTHGAYSPYKRKGGLLRPSSVSMTITLRMNKLPCEYRPFYREFAVSQLTTQGRLWAVQNNTLVWAYAHITNLRESANARKGTVEFDVDFDLPEGVWHKADKMRTFLVPHDICSFMECYDYKEVRPCWGTTTKDCCHCGDTTSKESCHCCECDSVEKDMALCYREESAGCCENGLQFFYDCTNPYKIVYNCVAGEKFFGGFYGADHLGEKICAECGHVAGTFYSNTEIPTNKVKITIHGKVTNPVIEINDNANIIRGEYDGVLEINPDGSVYFSKDCMDCDPIDVENWVVPQGSEYGWTVNPGNNRFIMTGTCCGTVCVYIEPDNLAL